MTVRWWAVRLLGFILVMVATAITFTLEDNRPDGPTCAALPSGTAGCVPIDWSPVYWLLAIGGGLLFLSFVFGKRT